MEASNEVKAVRLCSVVSRESGDDPAGSATPFERCLMVEVSPPYQRNALDSRRFPEGLSEILGKAMDDGLIQKFGAFMPDREHSEKGFARVLFFRRPDGAGLFSAFEKDDLLVPLDELSSAVEALLSGGSVPEAYRKSSPNVRDVFVCTHNNRDVCCGTFGDPVYKELRRNCADENLRVWRASHIGGHRFAPTLIEFPSGMWWGHLDRDEAASLVRRDAPFADFRENYRGWSGLGKFEQIAEREILAEVGWEWTGFRRRGDLLSVNEDDTFAEVRIDFEDAKTGESGAYNVSIEACGLVMTLGSSGSDPLEEVTQYRASRMEGA